jgi:hypothetical protein
MVAQAKREAVANEIAAAEEKRAKAREAAAERAAKLSDRLAARPSTCSPIVKQIVDAKV